MTSELVFIHTLDTQLFRWMKAACCMYGLEELSRYRQRKAFHGGRFFLRTEGPTRARIFVYRQVSKEWQYQNKERIAAFIEAYRADCFAPARRRAA